MGAPNRRSTVPATRGPKLSVCRSVGQNTGGVARRFYGDLNELVLLELDSEELGSDLIDEPAADGVDEIFPHLYRELPTAWVSAVHRWRRGPDGWALAR